MGERTIKSHDGTQIVIMILEGQGHGAMMAAPELFARAVSEALDWTPST